MEKNEGCFHEATLVDQNGSTKTIRLPVVQEIIRQNLTTQLPPSHPLDPTTLTNSFANLPIIDISNLKIGADPISRANELAKLHGAAKEWGMFLITKNSVGDEVVDKVVEVVKGFFGLSFEEKRESVGTYMSKDNMGYGRNFMETEYQKMLDWVDRLTMKASPKEASEGLNVWPTKPENFRKVLEEYVEGGRKVCDELLQALAETLSLERDVFLKYFEPEKSDITVKVNYYPPYPKPDQGLALPAHSDGTALTFLMEFGATGALQVLKDEKWYTVNWPPNALLVNFGDLMEIMSNGRLKSSWHRVLTHVQAERTSLGLFYRPPPDAEIEPVRDETSDANEEEGFKKVVVAEYLQQLYNNRMAPTLKQALTYAKA